MASVILVAPARAQQKPAPTPRPPDTSRWEIEFRARYGLESVVSSGGSGALPGPGESFMTAGNTQTRRVPSWMFGDGAALLNDVLASFGRSERITPLDGVLTSAGVDHATSHGVGVRVSRRWRPKVWIEADVDYGRATFTLLPSAIAGVVASADSFASAFAGLAASAQGAAFLNPQLSSGFLLADGQGHEILATGALVFEFAPNARLKPYVVGGGGVAVAIGQAIADIETRYRFDLPSGGVIDETDRVGVRFAGGLGFVALGGGGVRFALSRRTGIRGDVRAHFVQDHVHTLVSTGAASVASLPADAIWSTLTPGIQFVTHPSTGLESNLSAPALSGFRTLRGSTLHPRVGASVGFYFRF
jgi:hypothetical protein